MLDGLLGRGFGSKCKSLVKLTKTRIDVIRRKRKATEKFLKKDIADLLANGLDINAYQRADGLLVELVLSFCYDYVELSCDFVLKHLSIIQKQRECPEDCREAVSSLMSAAARFSDLPELRDLRQIFQERYGNSLDLFVNQEFVQNLTPKPSTLEKKVQLMQDIALEFSIVWDSKAFEKRMSMPPTNVKVQPKIYGSFNVTVDENKSYSGMGTIPRGEKPDVSFKERRELTNGRGLCNGHEGTVLERELDSRSRHELSGKDYKGPNGRERTILEKDGYHPSYQGRQEVADIGHEARNFKGDATPKSFRSGTSSRGNRGKQVEVIDGGPRLLIGRENTSPRRDYPGPLLHGHPEISHSCAGQQSKGNGKELLAGNNHAGQHDITNSVKKFEEDVVHSVKPHYNNAIPPPYVKPKAKASKSGHNLGSSPAGFDSNVALTDPPTRNKGNEGSTSERIQLGSYHSVHERQVVGTASVNGHGQEKDQLYQDGVAGNSIPKPRSARRRHTKPHPEYNDAGYVEDTGLVARKSRSKARDHSRRGLQVLFDDEHCQKDEEERILDKLLMQYSKTPSPYEPGRVRKSKSRRSHQVSTDVSVSPLTSRDVHDEKPEMVPPPRSISLPHEHREQSEAAKVFSRAASFQPDRSNAARHVHPKLPDYDDLAARFAALKGR
ncbi:hypothetical protein I3842_03G220900 [Carya illinoinensis]|uniref:IST1-like protein n=1 Tax=Carya illinoinensis TaxID=32201 RepID=A0A922FNM4_CARIL|nr:hypothetical protein I3842_03G220900 [Carya illinoinensis]